MTFIRAAAESSLDASTARWVQSAPPEANKTNPTAACSPGGIVERFFRILLAVDRWSWC